MARRVGAPGDVAGVISRIRVENFMCHSNLTIDLIENVNFITGQNGSGKSAILTALCVAFGIRARGTQRATTLKDFIKTGCSYALVVVEMKNGGPDAFKPEIYGKQIIIEKRITPTASTTVLKDERGKKVSSKKEDLYDIIDHLNIDVENPCVIMSQDKSREFLHSGNEKEKFKFFYKASLLQQVSDLLDANEKNIQTCEVYLKANEETFRPYEEELAKLDEEIQRAEKVEEMAQEVTNLQKKLAWSLFYDVDRSYQDQINKIETLRNRIPLVQARIDEHTAVLAEKEAAYNAQKESLNELNAKTERAKETRDQLYQELSEVANERARLQETLRAKKRALDGKRGKKRSLEQHARDMQERFTQSTQAEENERQEALRALQEEVNNHRDELRRLEEQESQLKQQLNDASDRISEINRELEERRARTSDLQGYRRRLLSQRNNQVLAFGGDPVIRLLRQIEHKQHLFSKPPIGPIGAHVTLAGDDSWALAVEVAVGKLLNAFIVSSHRDMLTLRQLAKECQHPNLQIIIFNFDLPLMNLPPDKLPDRNLLTVLSVLQTQNHVVKNVLVDIGSVERQVLVENYEEGNRVIFQRRPAHVREGFCKDGSKMFVRRGAETTLPKDRNARARIGARIEDRIMETENEITEVNREIKALETRKREAEDALNKIRHQCDRIRRRNAEIHQMISRKEFRHRDLKRQAEEAAATEMPNTEELEYEIKDVEAEANKLERLIQGLKKELEEVEVKYQAAKSRHDSFCDSAKEDAEAWKKAGDILQSIEEEVNAAKSKIEHYQSVMNVRTVPEIRLHEEKLKKLQEEREKNRALASEVCTEDEIQALGGVKEPSEKIERLLARLQDRVRREERNITPVEELQRKKEKVEKKFIKQKNIHLDLKHKIEVLWKMFRSRRTLFRKNLSYLSRQLRYGFNTHMKKKAFGGRVHVDYEAKTLKLEVQMPQDASNSAVRDTRALSGGERSYSTLCFALALHEMTEAPFRAMDEFDVFMDSISRKISLKSLVEFAIQEGSQWIFITPHDISAVMDHPKIKKQQMTAPRP